MRIVSGISLLLGAALSISASPFQNGGFENGTAPGLFTTLPSGSTAITGWTVGGGGIDYIGTYWTPFEGTRSVDLNALSAGSIAQTFDTTIGIVYTVQFAMSGNPDATPNSKTMTVAAASASSNYSFDITSPVVATRADMAWQVKSFTFTATAASTTLTFTSTTTGPAGPALDAVSVAAATGVPEPATAGLLALGVLGIVVVRRRK
jgi:choice-of-anchor C domain-containing protein